MTKGGNRQGVPRKSNKCRALKVVRLGTDFSGMDAYALACTTLNLGRTRIRHEFACDSNKACRALLKHKFNPRIIYTDVCDRKVDDMPPTDVYCWSAPCVSFSMAGKNLGEKDTTAHKSLFFNIGSLFLSCFDCFFYLIEWQCSLFSSWYSK